MVTPLSLNTLVYQVWTAYSQSANKMEYDTIVTEVVGQVPSEELGKLILEADHPQCHAAQVTVKSRIGFPRYTFSWVEYLQAVLCSIVIVILDLDRRNQNGDIDSFWEETLKPSK